MTARFGFAFSSMLVLALSQAAHAAGAPEETKGASAATVAAQQRAAAALPADDARDAEFAARGFIATRADKEIRSPAGRTVFTLGGYDWVSGKAPDTVNPSLWREMTLLGKHGLFKVSDGVWQVRGFDVSNMTVVSGKTGWIVIDPLTAKETAAAAIELVNQQLGNRPVSAVIYSHSHADHYGGVRGVLGAEAVKAGKAVVIAPDHFVVEAVSENIMAGQAMGRRAMYQFGAGLAPGPRGQMGSGIGPALANGEVTLIAPTDSIVRTGETRLVDGVAMEFQIVSGSEAPSELNVYLPAHKVFLSAEMSTCSLHNILTPRGAKVRDARAWAGYLDEALRLYGQRSDVVISSHCWPRFGQDEVQTMLASQRDNYRYLHDQTVRLMNKGETAVEIAEQLEQPAALAKDWFNHGYYGTYSHNSKAIYQFYLGWYDANPANLNPYPPAERARRTIAEMGGARKVLGAAKKAIAAGDYRWSSDLLSQLVFAEPGNAAARALLADSFEQQGYQAESAIWRNQFLTAAAELRGGAKAMTMVQSPDLVSAVPTQLLLDAASTRFDPTRWTGQPAAFDLVMSDRNETASVRLNGTTMIASPTASGAPVATLTGPRQLMLGLLFVKAPLAAMEKAGLKVSGERAAVEAWLAAVEPMNAAFNIVEP